MSAAVSAQVERAGVLLGVRDGRRLRDREQRRLRGPGTRAPPGGAWRRGGPRRRPARGRRRARRREAPVAERAVADDGDVVLRAVRRPGRVDVALAQVIEHLVAGDRVLAQQSARLLQIGDVEVRHAERADLALVDQLLERAAACRPAAGCRASAAGRRRGSRCRSRRRLCSQARDACRAWLALWGSTLLTMNRSRRGHARGSPRRSAPRRAAAVQLGGVDVGEAARDAGAQRRDLASRVAGPRPSARSPARPPAPRPASARSVALLRSCVHWVHGAIESVDPAPTRQTAHGIAAYPATAELRRSPPVRGRSWRPPPPPFKDWSRRPVAERAAVLRRAGDILDGEKQAFAAVMTAEMGKLIGAAGRRRRSAPPPAATTPTTRERFLRPEVEANGLRRGRVLPAAGRGAGGDALEFPVLAGDPVRGARAGGRQRRAAQARVERPAMRAGAGGSVRARGRARRRVPDAAGRVRPGGGDHRRSTASRP